MSLRGKMEKAFHANNTLKKVSLRTLQICLWYPASTISCTYAVFKFFVALMCGDMFGVIRKEMFEPDCLTLARLQALL